MTVLTSGGSGFQWGEHGLGEDLDDRGAQQDEAVEDGQVEDARVLAPDHAVVAAHALHHLHHALGDLVEAVVGAADPENLDEAHHLHQEEASGDNHERAGQRCEEEDFGVVEVTTAATVAITIESPPPR